MHAGRRAGAVEGAAAVGALGARLFATAPALLRLMRPVRIGGPVSGPDIASITDIAD